MFGERVVDVDVLVVGGGGAGVRAAIEADSFGAETLLLNKGITGKSGCTPCAKGGYSAPFGHIGVLYRNILHLCFLLYFSSVLI